MRLHSFSNSRVTLAHLRLTQLPPSCADSCLTQIIRYASPPFKTFSFSLLLLVLNQTRISCVRWSLTRHSHLKSDSRLHRLLQRPQILPILHFGRAQCSGVAISILGSFFCTHRNC